MNRKDYWTVLKAEIAAAEEMDAALHPQDGDANLTARTEIVGKVGEIVIEHSAVIAREMFAMMGGAVSEALAKFMADFTASPFTTSDAE